MESLGEIFHHGLIVDDLATAMAQVGAASGAAWTTVRAFDPLPVWSPAGGAGEIRLQVAYSREGPLRLELVQAEPGTPYDQLRAISRSHLGVWVDDVAAGVATLQAQGWRVLVAGAPPERGYGMMVYLARDGAPVIELVDTGLRGMMADWWATSA